MALARVSIPPTDPVPVQSQISSPAVDGPAWPARSTRTRRLPAEPRASGGLPAFESVVFIVLAPLLSIPLLVATMGARWVVVTAVSLSAVAGWLCLARRFVIGDDWVANRHVWRYRVTDAAALEAVELVDNEHGGLLLMHPKHGRAHRVRRPELARTELRVAVGDVLRRSDAELGTGVAQALAVQGIPGLSGAHTRG